MDPIDMMKVKLASRACADASFNIVHYLQHSFPDPGEALVVLSATPALFLSLCNTDQDSLAAAGLTREQWIDQKLDELCGLAKEAVRVLPDMREALSR